MEFYANLDVYSGLYKDGKPNGYGQYQWREGSIYVGEFLEGMKHGSGKWMKDSEDPKGNQYTGEYKLDKKHGEGQFNWKSGNWYKGEYIEDLRHGYGEMHWADGSSYKGDWELGKQHGFGLISLPNGKVKQGKFVNNKFISEVGPDTVRPAKLIMSLTP